MEFVVRSTLRSCWKVNAARQPSYPATANGRFDQHRRSRGEQAHAQRGPPVEPARPGRGEHVQGQRQHERARVELQREAQPEQHGGHRGPVHQGPPGAPPVDRVDRADRAGDHRQVPVVERVEHQRWTQRPDQGPPARQPAQHPAREQPERRHQQRRVEQELAVVVGEQRAGPDQQAGQDRVLDRAADQLPVRRDRPVHVREHVPVDVATQPQLLDVGVADVVVDPLLVVRPAAAGRVELGAHAARLVRVPEDQRDPGEQHQHGQQQPAPGAPDRRGRLPGGLLRRVAAHRTDGVSVTARLPRRRPRRARLTAPRRRPAHR